MVQHPEQAEASLQAFTKEQVSAADHDAREFLPTNELLEQDVFYTQHCWVGQGLPDSESSPGLGMQPARQVCKRPAESHPTMYFNVQHEKRKRAEDALVREAERSGRFVDLAVHSFNAALPPSRLIVPEGVSVNFVRRQIQYRVEV